MKQYIPTTAEVREMYSSNTSFGVGGYADLQSDRWLEQLKQEVRENGAQEIETRCENKKETYLVSGESRSVEGCLEWITDSRYEPYWEVVCTHKNDASILRAKMKPSISKDGNQNDPR